MNFGWTRLLPGCGLLFGVLGPGPVTGEPAWKAHVGKAGTGGWRCHVIQSDPDDHGPDGFHHHDWDGDGDLDVFVNFEEGGYSRLYFNPGPDRIRQPWTEFVELGPHGNCEDSGIGDLDGDGDVDYIANGGHVYFNPGTDQVKEAGRWSRMTLFGREARCPLVEDVDGDGRNDLVVGAAAWYRQPATGPHEASNWRRHELGRARWPMNGIFHDMDGDGDRDLLVSERREQGFFYYVHRSGADLGQPWPVVTIDPRKGGMFMAVGDVNGDGRADLVRAAGTVEVFLRTNDGGRPDYRKVELAPPQQPDGVTGKVIPKGVAIMELDGDPSRPEVVVIPEYAAQLWTLAATGDGLEATDWTVRLLDIPGPVTRRKMDHAHPVDLDGDGDLDLATTEENGGWGVIWFENPGGGDSR